MEAKFFKTELEFRNWLEKNHKVCSELIVGYYKVKSKKSSMTWSQSVDQALCFGWIDGVRRSINEESYCIRFTPRRKDSIWSAINISKVENLISAGLMTPEGLKSFSFRTENKSNVYSHENELALTSEFENQFKTNNTAWDFFNQQAPSYKKTITHWIMSAKQEKTRISRLEKTITYSDQRKRIN